MFKSQIIDKLIEPTKHFIENSFSRKCNTLLDEDWIKLGVTRVINQDKSGRALLENILTNSGLDINRSGYFNNLSSPRRLKHLEKVHESIADLANIELSCNDPFSKFSCLLDFEIFSGDGHFHEWACHDPRELRNKKNEEDKSRNNEHQESKVSIQHFYAQNMRTLTMEHLALGLSGNGRIRENDTHALKRVDAKKLRLRNGKRKKVLLVWDRAGQDQPLWHKLKHNHGIYFLTREKKFNVFTVLEENHYDEKSEINMGVLVDEIVEPSNGVSIRRVTFKCPCTGETYRYLTNLPKSIPPGLVAYFYKCRWDIEKSFDSFKNKYHEKKSWASSNNAKNSNALFLCLTFNLLQLLNKKIKDEEKVEYTYDIDRKKKRLKSHAKKKKTIMPSLWKECIRVSQLPLKFIRWIKTQIFSVGIWSESIAALKTIYSQK